MGREESIEVFRDTERICKTDIKIKEFIKKSVINQKLILEQDSIIKPEKNIYSEPVQIIVSNKRSFEAASSYRDYSVCVHNFASASNPGGGVVNGANAQEECLCRCSSLYFCLNTQEMWDGFYKPHRMEHNSIHNDDIIYTPNVVVFKTDTAYPRLMKEEDWYEVNVVTCAAPNLRDNPGNRYNSGDGNKKVRITDKELLLLHEKRLRRILDVAQSEGNQVVVLGAFGCGAFANNPMIVARAAKNVIEEYRYAFKVVEFAIYCSPRDTENFKVFERTFAHFDSSHV